MKIVNLTAHEINVKTMDGTVKTYEPSGMVARAYSKYETYGDVDNVLIEVEGDPTMEFGIEKFEPYTLYIVSYPFAIKLKQVGHPNLHQFVYPCSSKARRDYETRDIVDVPSLIAIQ